MITYQLSTDDVGKLHVHKIRGKRARCGLMLSEPEMDVRNATNTDVAKLLLKHDRGCWECMSEMMGLPGLKPYNRKGAYK